MTLREQAMIIEEAVDTFGFEAQLRQLQEECAELIVAASHYLRGRDGAKDNLVEELADVDIMISQMVYGLQMSIEGKKAEKLARLAKRTKWRKRMTSEEPATDNEPEYEPPF